MHFADAVLVADPDLWWLQVGSQRLRMPAGVPGPLRSHVGRPVVVGVRPTALRPASEEPGAPVDRRLVATLRWVERLGPEDRWHVELAGHRLVARARPGTTAARGDDVEVLVDTTSLQLFERDGGAALWHGRPPLGTNG